MFYIQQLSRDDCGFTSLKILLANIYKNEDYLYLKQDESHGAYSFLDLINIGKEYGLTLRGIRVDDDNIGFVNEYPLLVSIELDGNKHLLYLYKINKKKVYVIDPSKGKVSYKKEEFLSLWDRNALIVEQVEAPVKIKSYKDDVSLKEKILFNLLDVIAIATLFLGVAFVDESISEYIPISIFIIGFVLELISQKIVFIKMKKMTNYYIDRLEKIPSDKEEFLKRLETYKRSVFVNPKRMTINVTLLLILCIILFFNTKFFIINIGVIIMLWSLYYYLLKPFFYKIKIKGDKLEEDLINSKHIGVYKTSLKSINKTAIRYGDSLLIFKLVSIFILLLSIVLVMKILSINETTYLLINFSFMMIIFDRGLDTIDNFSIRKDIRNNKARLINYIK